MPPIVLAKITDKQKLTIKNGINIYLYLKDHYDPMDDDFRDVFTDFYLSTQGVMYKPENRDPYFKEMRSCKSNANLIKLVVRLYNNLAVGKYEFSFATKLLHMKNNNSPIFDSKVRDYLKKEHNVKFNYYKKNDPNKLEKMKKDWDLLVNWYRNFLSKPVARSWISWFDKTFGTVAAKNISDVKKIDFIIFACN